MVRLFAVLRSLACASWRRMPGPQALASNHFVIFALLISYQGASHGRFLMELLGTLVLLPTFTDPLRHMPGDRLALLPMCRRERVIIRLGAFAMNPALWLALGAFATGRLGLSWWVVILAGIVQVLDRIANAQSRPWFPCLPGLTGAVATQELRNLFKVLDIYVAGLLSLAAWWFRHHAPQDQPGMVTGMTFLVVLALSTRAQCLFAFEGPEGMDRYRLLPVPGWRLLLGKDLAFLVVLLVMVAPLAPMRGLAVGLVALAAGHHGSLHHLDRQDPWRFASTPTLGCSLAQISLMLIVTGLGSWGWGIAVVLWVGSLAIYGRAVRSRSRL